MWRPHPRNADTNPDYPRAWATDDRSGMITNCKIPAVGSRLGRPATDKTGFLVGADNYDIPNEQLRTLIIPADPPPLMNARVEPYVIDETDWRTIQQDNEIRTTQDGSLRVTQPSQSEATSEDTG